MTHSKVLKKYGPLGPGVQLHTLFGACDELKKICVTGCGSGFELIHRDAIYDFQSHVLATNIL